jgi:TRAP-type mannitol/chloroaromatic compound transport system permease large subunit
MFRPHWMPPLPPEARTLRGWALWPVLWGMVPSIVLIFLVLGTIFMGLATRPRPARWARSARWCWRPCTSA